MSLVADIADALADLLTPISPAQDIQVSKQREFKPTPPCIDIYPDPDLFIEDAGFGRESVRMRWKVRVRVGANDPEGQTALLYEFIDPFGDLSIRGAILSDQTLFGIADVQILDNSGVRPYADIPDAPVLPGCEWTLGIFNREGAVS